MALTRANSRDDKTADDDLMADGINTTVIWGWRPTQYRATALFTKHPLKPLAHVISRRSPVMTRSGLTHKLRESVNAFSSSTKPVRYLLAVLTGNKEGSMGLVVLRVRPTPTRFPINSLYTPMDSIPLFSIPSVWRFLSPFGCHCRSFPLPVCAWQ